MKYRLFLFLIGLSVSVHAMDETSAWITQIKAEVEIEAQRAFPPDAIESLIRKKLNAHLLQTIKDTRLQHLQTLLNTYPAIIRNKSWFEISLQELHNTRDTNNKKILLIIATELLTRHLQDAHDNNYEISYCPLLLACRYDQPQLIQHCLDAGFDPRTEPINQPSSVSWALSQYQNGNQCAHLILQHYETLEPSFSLAQLKRYHQLKQRVLMAAPVAAICAILGILYLIWQRMYTTEHDDEEEPEPAQNQADPTTTTNHP